MPLILVKSDPRARKKPCLKCGYSLRKNTDSRFCPECGLSVWLSLNGNDRIDSSNPDWLLKVAVGLAVMTAAQCVGAAAFVIAMLELGGRYNRGAWVGLLGGAYLMLYHVGLSLAATHEQRFPDKIKTYRITAQVVAAVGLLAGAGLIFSVLSRQFDSQRLFWTIGTPVLLLASALSTWAYFRKLAQRVPNSTVARLCGYLLLAPAVTFLKISPFAFFFLLSAMPLLNYIPWIYLPISIVLMGWFTRAFKHAAVSAGETWKAESAPQ